MCTKVRICLLYTSYPVVDTNEVVFTHIGTEKGLSQNTIFDITQDAKGNMWFATYDGVNRYNGYTCTVFQHDAVEMCIRDRQRCVGYLLEWILKAGVVCGLSSEKIC